MRFSHMFIPTLKEDPADAQVMSHKLMLRGGYIRRVSAGIYSYLPLGLRVLQKVSAIVREELNAAGAQELLLPMVQPKELWEESGRWGQYGAELLRLKDRKEADFCLGPTHEEVITALVRDYVKGYRHLPLNLYQIQTKFRDEVRPRFGLMRGREFIMKDAYSFDTTVDGALKSYDAMFAAYKRIFQRCGLNFCAVEADTGSIGGNRSHEFQVLADTGEDVIASCSSCGYAANVELAEIFVSASTAVPSHNALDTVLTPHKRSIEEVADFLGVQPAQCIKAVMFMVDEQPVMALCRGDHVVNEAKLKKALGGQTISMMSDAQIAQYAGPVGFVGPVGCGSSLKIIADHALKNCSGMVAGANQTDTHHVQVAESRDFTAEFFDIRIASEGDNCGRCGSPFILTRGIEVGHVFYLGTKYSLPMNAVFLDEQGAEQVIEMGCYGIGISRTAAAAIEQNHDDKGIIWPMPIAPFHVSLVRLGQDADVVKAADDFYQELVKSGIEVLYDDRDERPGVKFAESDLIGCPIRVNIGGRSLKEGLVEVLMRGKNAPAAERIILADASRIVIERVKQAIAM